MKLALIRRQFSPTGGAELYLQRLMTALQGKGHEIHLFAESWDGAAPGVQLHKITSGGSRAARPRLFAEAVDAEGDATKAVARAKLFATEMASWVCDRAVQHFGGLGVKRGVLVERLFRDVRALRIYEGTSEIQKSILAKELL